MHGSTAHPEEVMAEYEEPRYGENDDGDLTADDIRDEEYGLDDENEGDDEQYYDEYADEEYGDDKATTPDRQGYAEQEYQADPRTPPPAAEPSEASMVEGGQPSNAEALLGDVPVNVVVELGRVQLTADEVIPI